MSSVLKGTKCLALLLGLGVASAFGAENLIVNGTFDGPGTFITENGGMWSSGHPTGFACPGWNSEKWQVANSTGSGLAKPNSDWLLQANADRAGTYSLFIQSKAVYQEFTVHTAGRYRISFDECNRYGFPAEAAEVYLAYNGKTNLLCSAEYTGTLYKTFTQEFTLYGTGQYTLILSKADLSDGLKCVNYDNVAVELLEAYQGCYVDGSPSLSAIDGQPVYGLISLAPGEHTVLTAPAGIVMLDGGGIGEVTGWSAYKGGDESAPWRSGSGNVCDDYVQPEEAVRFVWNWRYYSGATAKAGGEVRIDGGVWTNLALCASGEHQIEARPLDGYAFRFWTGDTRGLSDVYSASPSAALTNVGVMALFVPTNTVRVPAGYCELEFVEGTGKQRIDTRYKFNPDTVFRMRFDYTKSGGGCYIGNGKNSNTASRFFAYNGSLYFDIPKSSGTDYSRTELTGSYKENTVLDIEFGDAYILDLEKGKKATGLKLNSVYDNGSTFCLFNTENDCGRVFLLRTWEGDALVRDFVPAMRLSDRAVGLWDNGTGEFFENVGEGALVGGEPFNDGEHLTVTAEPEEYASDLTPGYGSSSGWYTGRTQVFSAKPQSGDDLRIAPTKWRVLTRANVLADYAELTNGTGDAFTYVHDGHNAKVIWTWESQYRLTACAEGPGTVRFDDGVAAGCVTNWSVLREGSVSLTAEPDAGRHFLYWKGDLVGISGSVYDSTITCSLAIAQARTITAVFSDEPWPFSCRWTGAGDSQSFEDPANWSSEDVPGEEDGVLVMAASPVAVQAKEAHVLKSLTVFGLGASKVSLSFLSNLTVRTDIEMGTNGTLATTLATTVSNNVHIAAGGLVTHTPPPVTLNDPDAVRECLDWTVLGDMTVDENGAVDVTEKGLAPEKGAWINNRSSHGGRYDNTSKACYGSVLHPFSYGSGGNANNDLRGGGVVRLHVSGTLTVNGEILADAKGKVWYWNASGGSIDVRCGTLAGAGVIHATGGYVTKSGWECGGGGRVAVRQTVANDFTTSWSGKVSTYGAFSPDVETGKPQAGCGTVYLQSAADREGGGVIFVDNAGGTGFTDFPMREDRSSRWAYREATLALSAGTTLVLVNDVTVFDLDVKHANAKIDLNGHTLRIRSKAHEDGAGWAAPTGTCVKANGGRIEWKDPGFLLLVW